MARPTPRLALLLWLAVATVGLAAQQPERSEALVAVERLQAAFNAHDVEAMLQSVTEDIAWYSVNGASIATEAEGREALAEGMNAYFRQIPSARSEIEGALENGRFVTVRERALWMQGDEERSQASLAIYEVRDGLVAKVWYYPAQP